MGAYGVFFSFLLFSFVFFFSLLLWIYTYLGHHDTGGIGLMMARCRRFLFSKFSHQFHFAGVYGRGSEMQVGRTRGASSNGAPHTTDRDSLIATRPDGQEEKDFRNTDGTRRLGSPRLAEIPN